MLDNVYPTDFYASFDESFPEWNIDDVEKELSLRPEFLDVYAGMTGNDVIEYDPDGTESVTVAAGGLVHEKNSRYVCIALSSQTITPPQHLPTETNQQFQVHTILTYISAYVQEHADALVYKGVVNKQADLTATAPYQKGWTYKVGTPGTYAGKICEQGDVLICNKDRSTYNAADWDIIQTNIDTVDGKFTNSLTVGARAENKATGRYSTAEGQSIEASGESSHAEGDNTHATASSAHAEGSQTVASGLYSHAEGATTKALNVSSHAEGQNTVAEGNDSHAEGNHTYAYGETSHAEGAYSVASGFCSHAEGQRTNAKAYVSHSQGMGTVIYEDAGSVSGKYNYPGSSANIPTWANNTEYQYGEFVKNGSKFYVCKSGHKSGQSFVNTYWAEVSDLNASKLIEMVGYGNDISTRKNLRALDTDGNEYLKKDIFVNCNDNSTGGEKVATEEFVNNGLAFKTDGPDSSHDNAVAVFDGTSGKAVKESPLFVDPSDNSISMGRKAYDASDATTVTGQRSVATGDNVSASGDSSHAEGRNTEASGPRSHAEGDQAKATGSYSHAEGDYTLASGTRSHAEGHSTKAVGTSSHAEGDGTIANGDCAHAEGNKTIADAHWSHAEGNETIAAGQESHAEGITTRAFGMASHAEGDHTITVSMHSHVGGRYNVPFGMAKAPDWKKNTDYKREQPVKNDGHYYICYTAHTSGETFDSTKWTEIGVAEDYAEVIGNGDYLHYTRSNARALDWNGNEYLAGDAYVNCEANSTGGNKVATENYVVAWMDYTPISITSFKICQRNTTTEESIIEKGVTVNGRTLTFTLSGNPATPKTIYLDSTNITSDVTKSGNTYSYTISNELFTNNKTWTLKVTNERPDGSISAATSKNATLYFYHSVFYGVAADNTNPDGAFIRGLSNSVLDSDGKYNFELTTDAGQYMWYAAESSVTPKFNVGGFDGGFERVGGNIEVQGGSVTYFYHVYRSTNPNLGKQTVTVK